MILVLWSFIDHRFTAAHASEYVDGELHEAGRRRIERHTSICPQCAALLASLRRMVELLPGLDPARSKDVANGVLERLRREG